MSEEEKIELVRGSGNLFRDFGDANPDIEQAKAILAARIIAILDERELSTRKAAALTGFQQADFARLRNKLADQLAVAESEWLTTHAALDQHGV